MKEIKYIISIKNLYFYQNKIKIPDNATKEEIIRKIKNDSSLKIDYQELKTNENY